IGEYRQRTLDAKILIDRYLATPGEDGRKNAIKAALENYVAASTAWGYSITGTYRDIAWSPTCPQASYFYSASTGAITAARMTVDINRALNKDMLKIFWNGGGDSLAEAEGRARQAWSAPDPWKPLPPLRSIDPSPSPLLGGGARRKSVAPECRTVKEADGAEVTICR